MVRSYQTSIKATGAMMEGGASGFQGMMVLVEQASLTVSESAEQARAILTKSSKWNP